MSWPINPTYLTFDYASFIVVAPAYSNQQTYPQATIQNYWNMAICYVSNIGNYGSLQGDCRQLALNLLTAHLLYIAGLTQGGTVPYVMQTSTIDKVSIGLTMPTMKNQFMWWLMASPYGQQLYALLQANSVGGFYIGGSPQRAAFGYQGGFF